MFEPELIQDLIIRDKEARLLPLRLNPGQRALLDAMRLMRAQGRPVRIALLKARQFGGSTLAQACMFVDTYYRPRRETWIVAHTLASSRALGGMARRFHRNMRPWERRETSIDNASEIAFHNGSRINIATANNVRAGRGFTVHNLHASEVAFWRDAESAMLSLMQAVPDSRDTCVVVESTANGLGGYFHDLWRAACAGENSFMPVFVGWNSTPEYSKPFASPAARRKFKENISEEELMMMDSHELSLEQIHWRRACIADKCGGREDVFRQEYPLRDREAFLTSGRLVFPAAHLDAMYAGAEAPVRIAEIAEEQLSCAPGGRLKIWAEPEHGAAYVIGADVAEGIELGRGGAERDNSCVQVLHRARLEQVACWTGKIEPDALADIIAFLAARYNNAFAGIEANNHGLATIIALKDRCRRMYRREIFDERSRKRTRKLGWLTTSRTRPLMIYALAAAVREGEILLRDADTIGEMMSFVYDRNGRMNAQEGCHDDRVFALAIALQMHQQAPPVFEDEDENHPAAGRLEELRKIRSGRKGAVSGGWNVV